MTNYALAFGQALLRSLRDSEDTEALLRGEELSSVWRMPALVPMMQASAEGRAILAERPRIDSATVDFDALRRLPRGSLGQAFVAHLERNELDPDALTTPVTVGDDALARYLLERVRQTHDIWHTLVGFGTAGHEEVLLHVFQWPQLRMPYSALVAFFGTFKHLIGERRWRLVRHGLRDAYDAGRAAGPLLPVYWERHWATPLTELRSRLGVRPASAWETFSASAASRKAS